MKSVRRRDPRTHFFQKRSKNHTMKARRLKILYLCTGNSCRSQMAEGWTRHLKNDLIDVYSAGCEIKGLNPRAVRVMAEAGIDISGQRSKLIDEYASDEFDYVIMVCDYQAGCPSFDGMSRVLQVAFDDPVVNDTRDMPEEERLACYRRIRDEILDFVHALPESLTKMS